MSVIKPLHILDEVTITRMLANQQMLNEFPFLKPHAAAAKRKCCGRKAPAKASAYQEIKQAFANLAPDRQARLKELLSTEEVRVTYQDGNERKEVRF